ncbi:MAG: tRNA (adenosine(37)-N6)-threonylcarbamoyltransferase complex transferase subunit TsaD [Deltaproteobacteria bacterium]|nr:tRNA (adenosine(37)-N6)-threonylcarbamoyltransferase complex transferase subunit TsaD [Candidatus Anaeroferrophillus wilburensis]MBN2889314.1 tRNA (adenosine(37)-N6)-threonylcarbamoyltransferase complex transferase subunit TsaD [Deltaproteobacteria bacterium]
MLTFAIETSCDDTCAAVVEYDRKIRANIISSQVDVHCIYGGVVPELASRKHLENIDWVVNQALETAAVRFADLGRICVTCGPGLVGSLLVGISYAKSLAFGLDLPLVGVNHVEGHLMSIMLAENHPDFPFIGLVVSGGHTSLYLVRGWHDYQLLGRTIDDAAGEAFDKVAKMLGLGYPGGPIIEQLARQGGSQGIVFPRAYLASDSLDFSFSGLKTAVRTFLEKHPDELSSLIPAVAAAFQESVCDVLTRKALQAADRYGVQSIALAGGVSCNGAVRRHLSQAAGALGIEVFAAPPILCTDNAAMIGLVGRQRHRRGQVDGWQLNAVSRLRL